ncbi:MAG: hypothetical protein LBM38_05205 [Clostridiales bacterium]|jgi:hypothetical protein|nr:hypothetical protein [Clostridiales bacterium]
MRDLFADYEDKFGKMDKNKAERRDRFKQTPDPRANVDAFMKGIMPGDFDSKTQNPKPAEKQNNERRSVSNNLNILSSLKDNDKKSVGTSNIDPRNKAANFMNGIKPEAPGDKPKKITMNDKIGRLRS